MAVNANSVKNAINLKFKGLKDSRPRHFMVIHVRELGSAKA
jgi:hypothetical protein